MPRLTHLILEETAAKRPYNAEDKVELVQLLGAVWWGVLRGQHAFQEVAQHLQVRDVGDGSDLLEA